MELTEVYIKSEDMIDSIKKEININDSPTQNAHQKNSITHEVDNLLPVDFLAQQNLELTVLSWLTILEDEHVRGLPFSLLERGGGGYS